MSSTQQAEGNAKQQDSHHPLHQPYKSADALDEIVSTTTIGRWIALTVILVAFAAGLAWLFLGSLPQQTENYAVTTDSSAVTALAAPTAGTVTFNVANGDQVKEGAEVAKITPLSGDDPVTVTAPFSGNISDVTGANGIGVQAGAALMTVTATISDLNQVTFVTFVPQEIATLYANTEDVKIRYQTAKGQSEEIPGNVTFVSESPADPDSILDIVGGQDRLSLITEGDELPLHQVTVTPQPDSTVTGEQLPSVGQVVTLFNRYADPHPIDLLFGDE